MSTYEFDNQFNKMSSVLNSFAYNLTKNAEEAKDLFQETAEVMAGPWEDTNPSGHNVQRIRDHDGRAQGVGGCLQES